MKRNIIYFDDQIFNIECYQELLEDDFNVIGTCIPSDYQKLLHEYFPHALLIDVHMPLMNGFDLYEKIVKDPNYNGCPVFFISGDVSDENKIRSYNTGGIDFLPRGLKVDELIIRLSSKIKHYLQVSTKLELGNLHIDVESMKVTVNQQLVDLTLVELRILSILLRSFPDIITRDIIIEKIWGDESIKPATINTHLTNLRPKVDKWNYDFTIKKNQVLVKKKSVEQVLS